MKAATVGLLLGVFACCVVCEPVPNDDIKQTAEAEYYPGPVSPPYAQGRSEGVVLHFINDGGFATIVRLKA
jgi:hypothetical protein